MKGLACSTAYEVVEIDVIQRPLQESIMDHSFEVQTGYVHDGMQPERFRIDTFPYLQIKTFN